MFFYSDTNKEPFNPARARNINPTRAIMRHLDNYFFLKFLLLRSDDRIERHQATKELAICERKIAYHERNASCDHESIAKYRDQLKKTYEM